MRRSVAQRVNSWRLESWSLRSTDETEPGSPTLEIVSRASAGQIKVFRGAPPATKIALDRGQAVYLECRTEPDGLNCRPPDNFVTPQLECLVSPELDTVCRPPGESLPGVYWADQPGTRRCTVPPGGGLATCTEVAQGTGVAARS